MRYVLREVVDSSDKPVDAVSIYESYDSALAMAEMQSKYHSVICEISEMHDDYTTELITVINPL